MTGIGSGRARRLSGPLLAAALAAASGDAGAAETGALRERLAAPPLRNCSAQGPGFIAVPGTDTCLRVGGRVRAEAGTRSARALPRETGETGSGVSGRIAVDTRTETGYGPARAFVRFGTGQR